MLKLVTLDLDNTLWNVTPTLINAEKTLHSWLTHNIPQAAPLYQKDNLNTLRHQFVSQYPDEKYFPTKMRKYILRECFLQAGLTSSTADEHVEAAFSIFIEARNKVTLFPETLSILTYLSERFTVIALTNGNANLTRIGIDNFFTQHYSAESVGKAKPDNAMFLKALEASQCNPSEALHVGDHPIEDIQTAKQCGYNTIWFNQDQQQSSTLCNPTVEIHALTHLIHHVNTIHNQPA